MFDHFNDEALAQQAVNDAEAFTELYRRYADRVYRYFYSRVSNVDDAQDLTAQTFFALVRSISRYKPTTAFSIYLFAIARRKLADFLRIPVEVELDPFETELVSQFNVEQVIEQKLTIENILLHLRSLSPIRMEILSLRIFAGLTAAQVAEITQKSEGAVHVLLHRAISDLRRLVKEVDV